MIQCIGKDANSLSKLLSISDSEFWNTNNIYYNDVIMMSFSNDPIPRIEYTEEEIKTWWDLY